MTYLDDYEENTSLNTNGFVSYGNSSNSYSKKYLEEELNVKIIDENSAYYPEQFKSCLGNKYPEKLFCMGNITLLTKPCVMICGARNASKKGKEMAYKCARLIAEIADLGCVIASGYARGVDMAAHFGALEAGGDTVALLPYGLLKFRVNKALSELFDLEQFLVVSDIPNAFGFSRVNALRRNKLLVAFSKAVIVIEPGETGGTWYSAKCAGKMGKPLYFMEGERPEIISELESIGGKRITVRNATPQLGKLLKKISTEK